MRWPCRSKYFRKDARISLAVIVSIVVGRDSLVGCASAARRSAAARWSALEALADAGSGTSRGARRRRRSRSRPRSRRSSAALEQRVVVDVLEDLVDGGSRRRSRSMPAASICCRTRAPAALLDRALRARDAPAHARRRRALRSRRQPRDGRVDVVGVELAPREPLAELRLRELARGRAASGRRCRRRSRRPISGHRAAEAVISRRRIA